MAADATNTGGYDCFNALPLQLLAADAAVQLAAATTATPAAADGATAGFC